MKLFHKSFLLISSFFVVSGIVAFAVTSCGSSNPYKDTRTGDNTSIKSKKDAGNLKNVAIDHIATQNPRNVSAAETNDLLFKTLTNGGIDYVYASTQVYWELVYCMCDSYSKGTSQITVNGADKTNNQCLFLEQKEGTTPITFIDDASIQCRGFLDDNKFEGDVEYHFPLPTTDSKHFTLSFNSETVWIRSYALFAWTYEQIPV